MKNLSQISDAKDIATKEYVDPTILSYGQQYTEAELDRIFSLHKRVFIQLDYLMLPVLTFKKSETASAYFFYCYYETTTNDRIDYNFQSNTWDIYPDTLAQIDSPIFEGTPKAPTPTSSSDNTQIATKEYVDNFVPTKINNQNNVGISIWTGNKSEYEAITTLEPNTLYLVMEQG